MAKKAKKVVNKKNVVFVCMVDDHGVHYAYVGKTKAIAMKEALFDVPESGIMGFVEVELPPSQIITTESYPSVKTSLLGV